MAPPRPEPRSSRGEWRPVTHMAGRSWGRWDRAAVVRGRRGQARGSAVDGSPAPAGSGGGGCWLGSSMRWGGGQPAIGVAGQSPAALMDRPVVGPAQQRQVGQVGGAAVQPVDQMMGLTPGRGSVAAGEHTATVADGQGGALGGLDDAGGAAHLQRLGRGTTKDRGQTVPPPPGAAPGVRPSRSGPCYPAPPARSGLGPVVVPGRGGGAGRSGGG
jgi:hypothetical protein